jgi:hypothetical protein
MGVIRPSGSFPNMAPTRPLHSTLMEFVLLPRRQSFAKLPLKACIKALDGLKFFFQGFFAVAGLKLG